MKAQEGKIENTDSILEISAENKKLTNENRELQKKNRDISERLKEVEQTLSQKIIDDADKDDLISVQQETIRVRNSEITDLYEKNKKLTQECQILTVRMLEEKSKMVEMMNEANNMFESSTRNSSKTMT